MWGIWTKVCDCVKRFSARNQEILGEAISGLSSLALRERVEEEREREKKTLALERPRGKYWRDCKAQIKINKPGAEPHFLLSVSWYCSPIVRCRPVASIALLWSPIRRGCAARALAQ